MKGKGKKIDGKSGHQESQYKYCEVSQSKLRNLAKKLEREN
jgi:hypothetical protein